MAARITSNAKGDALLTALKRAFESNQNLAGSARKAVIFTESVRTQSYLKTLLESNGYTGRLVLLNSRNADESSQRTYLAWLAKNRDTANVSNSKSADMKAAIVAAFRDDAEIMIATESGAEVGDGAEIDPTAMLPLPATPKHQLGLDLQPTAAESEND